MPSLIGTGTRIGINLLYLLPGRVGGTETYAAGLLDGLSVVRRPGMEFVVYLNEEARKWPLPRTGAFERIICPVRAESRSRRYAFEQMRLPKLLARDGVGLVHSLGYVGPLRTPCPAVVTVPDLNYRAFGDEMPFVRRTALAFFVRQSVRRASRVITISGFARGQIAEAFSRRREEIAVTHLAPRPRAIPTRSGRPAARAYLLAFSSDSPNKNIGRLLDAFERARSSGATEHDLVLVGHSPPGLSDRLRDGRCEGVRPLGYLPEERLAGVLADADFLVFPSLYEGFGLPVLEAMAAGVPVACSRRASLPEVAGDAALYFDPESVDEIAAAIGRLSRDRALRDDLRKRGTENAARFSWEKTAGETLEVYESVLAPRG